MKSFQFTRPNQRLFEINLNTKNYSIQVNLDIANYFDNPTGVCSYQSCSIVDSLGNPITWIFGASLSGNLCSFSILIKEA